MEIEDPNKNVEKEVKCENSEEKEPNCVEIDEKDNEKNGENDKANDNDNNKDEKSLTRKQKRNAKKNMRRKKQKQQIYTLLEQERNRVPTEEEIQAEKEREERERKIQEDNDRLWRERNEMAHADFMAALLRKQKKLEKMAEYERQQQLLKEKIEKEEEESESSVYEDTLVFDTSDIAPPSVPSQHPSTGTKDHQNPPKEPEDIPERDKLCSFYAKTGCCRWAENCRRRHNVPITSRGLLIQNMFSNFNFVDEDGRISIEINDDTLHSYQDFFDDVEQEFLIYGPIRAFYTSRNPIPHLRGNVYIEYEYERDAIEAYTAMNNRYYASKPIHITFLPETAMDWLNNQCNAFLKGHCPRGIECHYLHLFKNPNNAYMNPKLVQLSHSHSHRDTHSSSRSHRRSHSHSRSYSRSRSHSHSHSKKYRSHSSRHRHRSRS